MTSKFLLSFTAFASAPSLAMAAQNQCHISVGPETQISRPSGAKFDQK